MYLLSNLTFLTKSIYFMVLLMMIIGKIQAQSWLGIDVVEEALVFQNRAFEEQFKQLSQIEWELISFEVPEETKKKSGGSIEGLYLFYEKTLLNIQNTLNADDNAGLSQLEKKVLWVYAQNIIIHQVYAGLNMILILNGSSETDKEEIKQKAIQKQDQVMDWTGEERIPVSDHDKNYQEKLKSLLLMFYAENFFLSIPLRKFQFFDFAHEAYSLYKDALWYNSENLRALLGWANFYIATANLSVLYPRLADQYFDKILTSIENYNPKSRRDPYNSYLLFSSLVGKSQAAITRKDYPASQNYIEKANSLAPQSGFLNYIRFVAEKGRTIFDYGQKDLIRDTSMEDPSKFFYSYSIESANRFLYKNYFNFVTPDILWTVFLNVGNSFYPASLLLEEGLRIGFDVMTLEIGALQNPLFVEGVGSYTGFLGMEFQWPIFFFKFQTQYGFFYDTLQVGDVFRLDKHQALRGVVEWKTFLYHNSITRLNLQQRTVYQYSLDKGVHTVRAGLTLPWILFDHGWGEFYFKNGIDFAYSSDPSLIRNRAEFFEATPISLKKLEKHLDYYDTPLSGVLLFHSSLSYRFYPLALRNVRDRYTAARGLFIAPSFYFGSVMNNIGKIDGERESRIENSFSILANIGYRFPGERTISLGAGWNDRDGVVLNILMH